jgi:hypothetical protein
VWSETSEKEVIEKQDDSLIPCQIPCQLSGQTG